MNLKHLLIFSDGGSRGNPGPAGAGAVVCDAKGKVLKKLKKYLGEATNNVAEYEGLLLGLKEAAKLKPEQVTCYADSLLVMEQMAGNWKVKHVDMKPLHKKASLLAAKFAKISYHHIPREKNALADEMANQAMDEFPFPFRP
jgi:ribonuclease HI